LFKILVLLDIKGFHIEKSVQTGLGEALQTVEYGEIVGALAGRGVVKVGERGNGDGALRLTDGWLRAVVNVFAHVCEFLGHVLVETRVGLFRGAVQVEHLPGANEKDGVGAFGGIGAGVKAHGGEFAEFVVEFFAKAGQLSQIERAEI